MTNYAALPLYNVPMEVIYIDSLFFINLATDYLLCLAAARICALKLKRLRYALAALFGAVYSVAVFLPGFGFLSTAFFKLMSGVIMALIAFAAERKPLRCTAVFLAVSAAFGGALWAVGMARGGLSGGYAQISTKVLLMSFALCYAASDMIFRCRALLMDKRRMPVTVVFLGRESGFMALMDTGNSLSDPVTGAPVMIVCPHALLPIFRDKTRLLSELSPVELVEYSLRVPELSGKIRLIPYSAVGVSGLLPVFRPDKVIVDEKENRELLIAVSQSAAGDGFEAII